MSIRIDDVQYRMSVAESALQRGHRGKRTSDTDTTQTFFVGINSIEKALAHWSKHPAFSHNTLDVYAPAQCMQLQKICSQMAIPYRFLRHGITYTAMEKQAHLFPIQAQKSITIRRDGKFYLVSGPADFSCTPALIHILDEHMGVHVPGKKRKNYSINPETPDPEQLCGLTRGIVSPFFPPEHEIRYAGVLCLSSSPGNDPLCAISLSLQSSMVIFSAHLHRLIAAYHAQTFPSVPLFFVDEQVWR